MVGEALSAAGVPHVVQAAGNLFSCFFVSDASMTEVRDFADASGRTLHRFRAFFHAMLDQGVYLPPSAFEAWFVSAAHDDGALDRIAAALPAAAARRCSRAIPTKGQHERSERTSTRPPSSTCCATVRSTTPTASSTAGCPDYHLSDIGGRWPSGSRRRSADRDITHLVASPLERAQETAQPSADALGLDIVTDERVIEAANPFEGQAFGVGDGALRKPSAWRHLYNPFRPSWGEPYKDIVVRMLAAMHDAREAAAGHEALIVSHQLPVWIARSFVEGRRLFHDPRKRQCSLASLTSFTTGRPRRRCCLLRAGRRPGAGQGAARSSPRGPDACRHGVPDAPLPYGRGVGGAVCGGPGGLWLLDVRRHATGSKGYITGEGVDHDDRHGRSRAGADSRGRQARRRHARHRRLRRQDHGAQRVGVVVRAVPRRGRRTGPASKELAERPTTRWRSSASTCATTTSRPPRRSCVRESTCPTRAWSSQDGIGAARVLRTAQPELAALDVGHRRRGQGCRARELDRRSHTLVDLVEDVSRKTCSRVKPESDVRPHVAPSPRSATGSRDTAFDGSLLLAVPVAFDRRAGVVLLPVRAAVAARATSRT